MAVPPIQYRTTDYPPKYRRSGYWRHARRQSGSRRHADARPTASGVRFLILLAVLVATLVLHAGIAAAYLGDDSGTPRRQGAERGQRPRCAVRRRGRRRAATTVPPSTPGEETPGAGTERQTGRRLDARLRPPADRHATEGGGCSDERRPNQSRYPARGSLGATDRPRARRGVATLLERTLFEVEAGARRAGPHARAHAWCACSRAATACSKACPASPRRSRSRRSRDAVGGDVRAHPVHARPRALRHRRHRTIYRPTQERSTSSSGRCSPTSCSPTRSTARRRRCSRRCSR